MKQIQKEINKALADFKSRGSIQNNRYDSYTGYIYKTKTYNDLVQKTKVICEVYQLDYELIFRYALNRRFNNMVSHFAEDVFVSHDIVDDEEDIYNKEVDFYINNIPFDLKMSVYPKGFGKDIDYALEHKNELIAWMYKHCSRGKRLHKGNKIFIVCYSSDGDHNQVKGDLQLVKNTIDDYISSYDEGELIIQDNSLADILFAIR